MLKAVRHKEIIALVQDGGVVEVAALATRFETSPITIRRDLIELQERGLLERTRGGAVCGDFIADGWARYESISYSERERENQREKRAVAELAAQLVSDGDCILVNGGTTSRQLAEALRAHQNLHVVTNGLTVAMEFARSQNAAVYLLPGMVDFKKMASVGNPDAGALAGISVRAAFLGVHGISPESGIGMLSPDEAAMNRAFVEVAQSVNVMVDSTKFHAPALFRVCGLNRVTRVITDSKMGGEVRQRLESMGVEVLVAIPEETPGLAQAQ
jgi:DeoR/GlpR family transcriptional regulator of sugar metabolism